MFLRGGNHKKKLFLRINKTHITMPPRAAQINIEIARICNANQTGLGPGLRAIWA